LATTDDKRRFLQEARLAAQLQHPNIIAIHDVGEIEGQQYYSMDFLPGPSLDQLVDKGGPLASKDAARYVKIAAEAVQCAHDHKHKVIHRDLKPSNVIMDGAGQLRVTDFGLAKQLLDDPKATQTFGFVGTPAYAAPEQYSGNPAAADERTDVYGLGAILYKLLTTHSPFQGASAADIIRMVVSEDPRTPRSLNADVGVDVSVICMKCLTKEPTRRYATARELADDLGRFLRDEPIMARPPSIIEKTRRWCHRNRGWTAAIATVTLAVASLTIGGFVLSNSQAVSRGRESLLQLRSVDRTDGWSKRVWAVVENASRVGKDATLQSQAVLTLAGLDASKSKTFKFGASHLMFGENGRTLFAAAVTNDTPSVQHTVACNVQNGNEKVLPSSPGGAFAVVGGSKLVQLAESSDEKSLALWDLQQYVELRQFAPPDGDNLWTSTAPTIAAHGAAVAGFVTNASRQVSLVVWNGWTGEIRHTIPCGTLTDVKQWPSAVAIGEDGSRTAVGWANGRIAVYDTDTGEAIADFHAGRYQINGLALTSSRRHSILVSGQSVNPDWLLASADAGGGVVIWNVTTGAPLSFCRGSQYEVYAVAFSPDGMTMASSGRGPTKLWNVATGQLLLEISANDFAKCLAFSPDGKQLAIGTQRAFSPGFVTVCDLYPDRGIRELRGLDTEPSKLCFSDDGRLVAALANDWHVAIWDIQRPELLKLFAMPPGQTADNAAITFNADGSQLAYSSGENAVIVDVSSGERLQYWPLPAGLCDLLVFPSADRLLSFRVEKRDERPVCRIRNLLGETQLTPVAEVEDFDTHVLTAAALPNRQWFIAEGLGGDIRIYDGDGRNIQAIAAAFHGQYAVIATDPTGEHVALQTDRNPQRTALYNVTSVHPITSLPAIPICLSPAGDRYFGRGSRGLAEAGLSLFNTAGLPLVSFDTDTITTSSASVATFDKRGQILAWGKRNGTVCVCFLGEVRRKLASVSLDWEQ
jgi:eukaryotic-like serine/threonine-protein kinase